MNALTRPFARVLALALLTLAAVAVAWTAGAPPAQAHDVLVKTSPADGASLARLPDRVTLTFDEPALALGTELHVTGPSGQVQEGKPVLVDSTVNQAIAPGSPAGEYTVKWRVTSEDGHPVSGTFTFTAAKGNGGQPSASAPTTATSPTATAPSSSPSAPPTTSVTTSATDQGQPGGPLPWVLGVVVVLVVVGGLVRWGRSRGKG